MLLDIPDRSHADHAWIQQATSVQQFMFEVLGDRKWDQVAYEEPELLRSKIDFAMYGLPTYITLHGRYFHTYPPGGDATNTKIHTKIINTCIDFNSDAIYVAPIYICLKLNDKSYLELVFRVGNGGDKSCIVDTNAERYEDWNAFICNAWYPECILMYPRQGCYHGDENKQVIVQVKRSVSCDVKNRVCRSMLNLTSSTFLSPLNLAFSLVRCKRAMKLEDKIELLERYGDRSQAFQTLQNLLSIPESANKYMTNKSIRLLRGIESLRSYLHGKDDDLMQVCHALAALLLFVSHCQVSAELVKNLMTNYDQMVACVSHEYGPRNGIIAITKVNNEQELLDCICSGRTYDV